MLSPLLEELLLKPELRKIPASEIRPIEDLTVVLFNDDAVNNHRIQIVDSLAPTKTIVITDSPNQNPAAHTSVNGTQDGLFACLSNTPKHTITCAGGTPSTVVNVAEDDLFTVTIGTVTHTDITLDQLRDVLAANAVELAEMVTTPPEPDAPPAFTPQRYQGLTNTTDAMVVSFSPLNAQFVGSKPSGIFESTFQLGGRTAYMYRAEYEEYTANTLDVPELIVTHADGVSPIDFLYTNSFTDIVSWYTPGFVSFIGDVNSEMNGLGPHIQRVPDFIPPNVTNIDYMFSNATTFNEDISVWNFSGVTSANSTLLNAVSFNRDMSGICVSNVATGTNFGLGSGMTADQLPVWGTCPI